MFGAALIAALATAQPQEAAKASKLPVPPAITKAAEPKEIAVPREAILQTENTFLRKQIAQLQLELSALQNSVARRAGEELKTKLDTDFAAMFKAAGVTQETHDFDPEKNVMVLKKVEAAAKK